MAVETMALDSLFSFGKYGSPSFAMLEDIIEDDPKYIEWLVENDIDIVQFDDEALEVIQKKGIA